MVSNSKFQIFFLKKYVANRIAKYDCDKILNFKEI
jgi:hypothetical protein